MLHVYKSMVNQPKTTYDFAIAELEQSAIWKSNGLPPIYRLLRRFGIQLRPPHYNSFRKNVLGLGVFFTFGWGMIMWFWTRLPGGRSVFFSIGTSLIAGGLFGLFMAAYYQYSASKHNLSKWENLPKKAKYDV